ncbi:MAG: bifunctional 5,10-methylenetetrahydrofolate dehydrogenase/5,10-methenyltetrahydrofolate cyclohydrolase [Lachnospiraceae bacterium]|nr:bifunctional 5,10-methylenetetrahydrofolate dehydrogenase/5,10-methenyltetrahydrofolate cyclohydrolase [Lachnospiraceae bacterium]
MAILMLGKEVTASLNERLKGRVDFLKEKGIQPQLAIVRVGENGGDISYERGAAKRCETLGVNCVRIHLAQTSSTEDVLDVIEELNRDSAVHGVLLLRPLPKHMDQARIENALDPSKDVDCMTDASLTGVFTGKKIGFAPCTAQACMEILDHYGIDCEGRRAVVIGRSLVIGKPAAMLLLKKNATVTVCHTRTKDLPSVTREADILIAAAGCAKMVDGSYVREGQVILDVGIHADENGKLCGDVDTEAAQEKAAYITPVPGGVGSVTTSVLLSHVIEAAETACAAEKP